MNYNEYDSYADVKWERAKNKVRKVRRKESRRDMDKPFNIERTKGQKKHHGNHIKQKRKAWEIEERLNDLLSSEVVEVNSITWEYK